MIWRFTAGYGETHSASETHRSRHFASHTVAENINSEIVGVLELCLSEYVAVSVGVLWCCFRGAFGPFGPSMEYVRSIRSVHGVRSAHSVSPAAFGPFGPSRCIRPIRSVHGVRSAHSVSPGAFGPFGPSMEYVLLIWSVHGVRSAHSVSPGAFGPFGLSMEYVRPIRSVQLHSVHSVPAWSTFGPCMEYQSINQSVSPPGRFQAYGRRLTDSLRIWGRRVTWQRMASHHMQLLAAIHIHIKIGTFEFPLQNANLKSLKTTFFAGPGWGWVYPRVRRIESTKCFVQSLGQISRRMKQCFLFIYFFFAGTFPDWTTSTRSTSPTWTVNSHERKKEKLKGMQER